VLGNGGLNRQGCTRDDGQLGGQKRGKRDGKKRNEKEEE
jgi:hypothetical protein